MNHKKIQRLWREEGLRVPQRQRRKRVGSSTVDAPAAVAPSLVWAVDFQFDVDERGRPVKICSIVDEHTPECIGGLVERSITADRLTAHLEDLVAVRGAPAVLRSDNGPEFISDAMADWAGTRTGLFYIPPGSPWHNGYVESFDSRLRDECLNINSFYSLLHAQVVIGDWKTEYNHDRRHSSLGYLAPVDYARQCTHQSETDDSHSDRTERRGRPNLKTQSGCNVSGAVAAGGTLEMCCGSDTFKGDLTLRGAGESIIRGTINGNIQANGRLEFGWEGKVIGGSVRTTGAVQLANVRIQGSLTFPSGKSYTPNDGVVSGGVLRPATVPAVPPLVVPAWFEYKYSAADWPGYNVVTLVNSGSGAGTCNYFNASLGTGWTTWLASLSANTVVDARACNTLSSNNGSAPTVQLKTNVVLLANGFDLTPVKFKAAGGATSKPSLYVITEDTKPADGSPTCGSGQSKLYINGTIIETSVRAIGYTPCTVDVGSMGVDQWTGTLYGGSWNPGGMFTFTADPIGLPGMGAEHGISVETKSVGALIRQRDVAHIPLTSWTP